MGPDRGPWPLCTAEGEGCGGEVFEGPGEALRRVEGFGVARWTRESWRRRTAQKVEWVDVVESLTVDGKVDGKSGKSRRACG